MEITRQNTGELTATLKLVLSPADYNEAINKTLKDYQRKAQIPGFRPGKVPFGMVKKMYGTAVFADEINRLTSENLDKYLTDEKLDILGQPLPNMELTKMIDYEGEGDIELYFDLGLTPTVDMELDNKLSVDYYRIKTEDSKLDEHVEELRRRYGKYSSPEKSEETDSLFGEAVELNEENQPLEGGRKSHIRIDIAKVKKSQQKLFTGKEKDVVIEFNPSKCFDSKELALLFKVESEEAEKIKSGFSFTVNEISRVELAEMNEEFYKKIFPNEEITDETAFRKALLDESDKHLVQYSDQFFMRSFQDKVLETTPIELPHDFMKRWLLETNQGQLTAEDIEKDYDKYTQSMKWQLVENCLIKKYNIEVAEEEILAATRSAIFPNWENYGFDEEMMQRLDAMAREQMQKNQKQARMVLDGLYDRKISQLAKDSVTLVEKDVTMDEFIKLQENLK